MSCHLLLNHGVGLAEYVGTQFKQRKLCMAEWKGGYCFRFANEYLRIDTYLNMYMYMYCMYIHIDSYMHFKTRISIMEIIIQIQGLQIPASNKFWANMDDISVRHVKNDLNDGTYIQFFLSR